jgi:carboxymethylenebutenolidase
MKQITFISMILLFKIQTSAAQQIHSCCSSHSENKDMTAFAGDPSFAAAHESPIPFNYTTQQGKMISFPTPDGKTGNAYEVKSSSHTKNVLFIFHEWWGLNNYIKQRADELQSALGDVTVIALDFYDGKVADNADSAGIYMKSMSDTRFENIVNGALNYVGKDARICTLGWCFGGGLSLRGTLAAGKQAAGCVMYYGMPSSDVNVLKQIHADVLGLFAEKDKWITPEVVSKFQENMKAAGKNLTVKNYDADHAFANPSNPHFNKTATADANATALDFLKKHFAEK